MYPLNYTYEPSTRALYEQKTAADTRVDGHAKGIGRDVFYHRGFNNNSDQN